MDFREPKKKRVGPHIKPQQPFPILIESESVLPVANELWPLYIGNFIGDSVIVCNPEEMISLYTMGFFGKGSFSRGYPSFGLTNKKGVPPIIKERQWQRRRLWMRKLKNNLNPSSGILTSNLQEMQAESDTTKECVMVPKKKLDNTTKEVESCKIENDSESVINDIDMSVNIGGVDETTLSKENKSESQVFVNEDISSNHGEVLVLADSDVEDLEKVIKHPQPHLEVESFKTAIETLTLTLEEAFFLSYALGCLQVIDMTGEPMSVELLWQSFCEAKPDFIESYVAYHYFRAKGWIVKSGFKFGGDFLLYKQGPPFYHASYVVLVEKVDSQLKRGNNSLTWTKLHGLNRLAENSGKDIITCQIVFPTNLTPEDAKTPKCLFGFQVNEQLVKRWISSQERTVKEELS